MKTEFGQSLLAAAGIRVRDRLFGTPEQRAVLCAYQAGFSMLLRKVGRGNGSAERETIGDACISCSYTCHVGAGCACNG